MSGFCFIPLKSVELFCLFCQAVCFSYHFAPFQTLLARDSHDLYFLAGVDKTDSK